MQGMHIVQTRDSGYIISGRTGAVGLNAGVFFFAKLNADMSEQWTKSFGGTYINEARSILELPSGGYMVTGVTVDYPDTSVETTRGNDMIIMRLDANGDTVWVKHFGDAGNDTGDAMDTDGGEGIVAVGRYGIDLSNNDFFLVRIKANGDTLWTKRYGGAASDVARAVRHTRDGGFIVAGTTKSYGPSASAGNIWLLKTDANGDTTWTKIIGTDNEEECYSVKQTYDGGYILTGRTGTNSAEASDIYVVKTDVNGDTTWTKTYGAGNGNDLAREIIQTTDSGYALTGFKHFEDVSTVSLQFYILKLDEQGIQQWDTAFGNTASPNGAYGYSIVQTNDGNLAVCGYNDAGSGGADIRAVAYKIEVSLPVMPTGIDEAKHYSINWLVYPNPVSDLLNIQWPDEGATEIKVYDIFGRLQLKCGRTSTLNFNRLIPGTYLLTAEGQGNLWRQLVVKQ